MRLPTVIGRRPLWSLAVVCAGVALLVATCGVFQDSASAAASPSGGTDLAWPLGGGNTNNTRNAAGETAISPATASQLTTTWQQASEGNYNTTPTVVNGVVYSTNKNGYLQAIDAQTGTATWTEPISNYTGVWFDTAFGSPAYHDGTLILGDRDATWNQAHVFAVNAATGAKEWDTVVSTAPQAYITDSAEVVNGVVYVGVSSEENLADAANPLYHCCTFRGSVVALSASDGHILWQTYTVPDNGGVGGGYSGAGVWGSTPVADPATGLVYVGTGQNYSVPVGVCSAPDQTDCDPPAADDYFDSVLALDMTTGQVVWARRTLPADDYWAMCVAFGWAGLPCGPDNGFGQGPMLFTAQIDGEPVQLLGIGQKDGSFHAYDPVTGATVWEDTAANGHSIGPGGASAGLLLGSATDGQRIYVAVANTQGTSHTVTLADGSTKTFTSGYWAALDPANGQILWAVADPNGAPDLGMMTVANGVVFAPSMASSGADMYALDASDGTILQEFGTDDGAIKGGAAVVDGTAYWASEDGGLTAVSLR